MNMRSAAENTARILGCRTHACNQPVLCSERCVDPACRSGCAWYLGFEHDPDCPRSLISPTRGGSNG